MPKVKLPKNPTFNGMMGYVKFTDGVSDEVISFAEAKRLGAFTSVVDADSGLPLSETADMKLNRTKTAEEIIRGETPKHKADAIEDERLNALRRKQDDAKLEPKQYKKKRGRPPKAKNVETQRKVEVLEYSMETLASIADEKGLAGIRDFAKKHDVEGKSINELINNLMMKKTQAEQQAKSSSG